MARRVVIRTYRLRPETVERIDRMTADQSIYPSSLVDVLLTVGLDLVERGALRVEKEPVEYVARGVIRGLTG